MSEPGGERIMSAAVPGRPGTARGAGADGIRLRLYPNPLRLAVSPSLWRAVWYLAAYLAVGWVLFSVAVTVASVAAGLAVTLVGIPLLVAAAAVIRGCANAERHRLRGLLTEPLAGKYRTATRPGVATRATTAWKDAATWRDVAYLAGLTVPLSILDTVVLSIWAWFVGMITLPLWYWAPWAEYQGHRYHGYELGFYFPHGPYGPGAVGVFIGSLPAALLAAAAGLAGFLLFNYVLVITAKAQVRVARALLRPPADPLAEARLVLERPGPLGPLLPPAA